MKIWAMYSEDYKEYTHVVPIDEHYNNKNLMEEWFEIGGKPVKNTYTPMEFKKEFKNKKMCNITKFFHQLVFIDDVALDALSGILSHSKIEILPLICKEKNLYAINVLDVCDITDILDMNKSEFDYFRSGRIMRVKKFIFIPERIEGKDIIMLNGWMQVVVSDNFKHVVEENNLIGVTFELLWDSEADE